MISLVVDLADGQMIEAAMVGRDSVVGGFGRAGWQGGVEHGDRPGRRRRFDPGRCDAARGAEQSADFRTTLIRHEQTLFAQAQQSAACNASHSVEARLARWLLWTRELSGSDTLGLTQEFLAQMLGVRRTSVSLVANTLQNAGLIRYRRGRIEITDLEGLRAASCECYGRVKIALRPAADPRKNRTIFFCREP